MAPAPAASSEATIERAAALLRDGGVVAIPTETVYGLAANALDAVAVARVFEIKRRPSFDPLIVHVSGEAMLQAVAGAIPAAAYRLMERFWPGPLTIVLMKAAAVPGIVTAGAATVAVRAPAHPVARAIIERAGVPLAAPSANPFGRLSPTRAQHVWRGLGDAVDLIVDGGPAEYGLESTIVSLDPEPALLRAGAIGPEEIEAVIGPLARGATPGSVAVPGNVVHHYAPATPLNVVDWDSVPAASRSRAGWLGLRHPAPGYAYSRVLSPTGDLREAAAMLFEALHELDERSLERIDAERIPERGIGLAIADRLRRAEASSS
ncbi:MAG TPA: L-threonylcarbamoyladenylate synthase [Candidatus Tumulicola sp.]